MGCPYSDEELTVWDGVENPMGDVCYSCEDFDCEHNPNCYSDDELISEALKWIREVDR